MSQIPRFGGPPRVVESSTVKGRTAKGGVKITTTTNIKQLEPVPGPSSIQRSLGSRLKPPARRPVSAASPAIISPHVMSVCKSKFEITQIAMSPGQYNMPAQFGPMTLQGKGMVYSSPPELRERMASKVPKNVKYTRVPTSPRDKTAFPQGPPLAGSYRGDRKFAQGTPLGKLPAARTADAPLAGNFNVYGRIGLQRSPRGEEELLNERKINTSAAILHDFHKRICLIFDKPDAIFKKRSSKFLAACTGLFSIYVSRCIAHTIESVVKFTQTVDLPSYLKLYVGFEANLILKPTAKYVIKMFEKLLDDIISVGKDLSVMEKGRIKGYESKKICLGLTDEFIKKCKNTIVDNITRLYEPILEYLRKLELEFGKTYSDINSESLFCCMDVLFDDGCKKIQYYKNYIRNVAFIPDNEYFRIGQLNLIDYREKLHKSLQMITDSIFNNLSSQHLWEVNDICDSFQLIKIRATQQPATTEELIEIGKKLVNKGKFMTWVRNEQLESLNQRVQASLNSLCNIITLGILDEYHINLNSIAMNWMENIMPIIEKHFINYEQLKFEAEEKLQKVIEDINVLIKDMYPILVILDEMDDIKFARKYLSKITLHMTKIKEIQLRIEWINSEEICLSFPKSGYVEFENLKDYVYPFYHLLKLSLDVQKHVSVWRYGQFDLLDYKTANETVEKFCKELNEIQKNYRKKLRQAQDENLPVRFKGTVDDPDILNWPAPLKLCGMSLNILEDFKPSLTVMKIMCNKNLRPRHWKAISEIAGFNLMPNAGTTLKKMMEYDLEKNLEEYEIISTCATKEQQLLDNINSLKNKWENIHFIINKNKENIWILIQLEDIQIIVDEHMIKIQTMRSSVFVKPYEKEVIDFYENIFKIFSVLHDWNILQNAYLKLLPIFSIEDVIKHIPNEEKHFKDCHLVFMKYTKFIQTNSKVIDVVSKTNIVEDLRKSLNVLKQVQKGVDTYLEITRLRCPRLYLISNEELINLTATNSDFSDERIFLKIFPGIKRVKFNIANKELMAILSQCNEEVILKNPIKLSTNINVDEILTKLQKEMLFIIKYKTADCYKIFKKTPIKDLLKKYPQQSLQLMARIFWTDQVENALKLSHNIRLLIYKRHLEENIEEKINIISKNEATYLEGIVIKNLLLADLNNQYLLSSFVKDGLVIDDNHFDWQVQLRYYFQKSLCTIKILNHSLDYSYEYLGNNDQIVLTPLTDRCFITLLNAYFFNFYGLITGMGQIGKSVTLKYLAEALGKLFFSFSCINKFSSQLTQILKGTALCGSWLSLQNIDQLQIEVLSIISQELLKILDCKKNKSNEIIYESSKLPFDNSCFIFVQLSTERANIKLPENFKAMFRTFTLCQPDFEIIIQSLLACQGIKNYKSFSKIIQQCLTLLPDVLGFQKQYNFKLKEIKRILMFFEQNKCSDKHYLTILCNSFRNAFLPGLLDKDHAIFEDTLSDIFQEYYDYTNNLPSEHLQETLAALNLNLYMDNNFLNKIMDVYKTVSNKTSRNIILLGDTNTGKTTILKLCAHLFENINIKLHIINPKCITYRNLMGETSTNKNVRWTDGVLLKILREAENNTTNKDWILFDGYIDKLWTKDFLSVLESGKLFLESLETILLNERTTLIFETTNLDHSSPAMVSRSTTIYFPKNLLNEISLIETWLKSCKSDWLIDHKVQIEALLKWFIFPCLKEVELSPKYIEIDNNSLTKNTLIYFELILDDACSKINKKEEDPKNMVSWIHATLIQAGILAFSSVLTQQSRQKFDEFYKQLWRGQMHPYPNCLERLEVGIPTEGFLFDFCYLYKQRGTWKQWADLVKNEKLVQNLYLSTCIVPTVHTMRCNFLLDLHIKYKKQLLINGPKGTGKSIALKDCYINRLPEKEFEKGLITINRHLTGNSLQKLLLSKLNKGRTGNYSASTNKRFICLVDDLQYSKKDENDISSVTELIRQHLDHNLWYDLKNLTKISLEKINFIAAVGFTGDKPPPKRFMRHFNILGVNEFSHDSITKIYSQNLMQSWKKSGFPSDMLTVVNQIVNASLQIYLQIQQNMKATLNKSHYVFDIFSLSKVIYGCSFLKKETYDGNKKIYIKLWVHEILRVYSDKLFIEDIRTLTKYLKEAMVGHFNEELVEVFPNYEDPLPFSQLFFGTFNDRDLEIKHRHYDEINFQHLKDSCLQDLHDYNENARFKLDLIFFDYSLEKLARICRILTMPNENALLLGITGCGRQSLAKFASFLFKHEYFQPIITRDYNEKSWGNDFKHVLKICGGLNKKCLFFIGEDQLINENFFEIIDYYIRDGEVTDLYDTDGKQDVLELSRLAAQGGNRNLDISTHKVFLYFNKKCRENFHLFLSLNTITNNLRMRILKYPALASRFNIIFWNDWPDVALNSIGKYWIKNLNLPEEVKEKAISAALYFHRISQSETSMFITPKAYIHLNKLFVDLVEKKQKSLTIKMKRFQQGLSKLSYAATQILNMQKALAEYQPLLEEMTKNAIEMTEQIALETIEVERASALVRKDEKIASEQAVVAQVLKSECEAELAQAIPILEDAISALNTLKPSDITLVKSMKNPPDAIKLVMASVCVIKDVKPDRIPDPSTGRKTIDYWGPSKRILGDMNFLQTLKDFDKDHIKPEIMVKIRKEYLPHKDFKPHVVAKASSAAEGLCKWIIAMDMYDRVAKEVAPKKEKLNKAEREYAETMLVLNEKKEEVVRIEAKLAQLNALLSEATKKQVKLQVEVDLCNKKLNSAQKLIGGLSGEKQRWTTASENLQKHYEVLAGDILISSAFIAYLPSLNNSDRINILTKWKEYIEDNNIPFTRNFNFSSVLSGDLEMEHWAEFGLPSDTFFIENAIIFNTSKYFRLLLDPHGKALEWITNFEDGNNMIITKFTFIDWLRNLKYCIKHGKPILIKDTKGYIPPCLNYLIYGQTFIKQKDLYITIDGEDLKLHGNFRLYIISCKPNLSYTTELKSRLTLINFSLTSNALKEDVLKIVVEIEKPEIRKLSKELVQKNKEIKAELKELEVKILKTLCESKADILEDEESILILDKTKELTKIAMEKQEKTTKIADVINSFKEKYITVAEHVASLFFCIDNLQKLHHIYQFSLKWFKNTYFMSILNAGKSRDLSKRCNNLCDTFTYDLYKSISKGLFEKDKILFTFWLATEIAVNNHLITQEEIFMFFNMEQSNVVIDKNSKPEWVSNEQWANLHKINQLDAFQGILNSFIVNSKNWQIFLENPYSNIPYNNFTKLILIRALKPNELYTEIINFIKQILGSKFLLPQFFNIQEVYNESYSLTPILFILTAGLDVLNILYNFARTKQFLHKFYHLSLDNYNITKGEKLIVQGKSEGCWILLQNCQYTKDWLYKLEQNLENMDFDNTNENFRLFLTSDDIHEIPLELIQNSIKIIDESPSNLRKNLLKVYNKPPIMIDDYFYGCPGKQETFSKLLYSLCHFHFLIQKRQKFSNWNIQYKFDESDLMLSLEFLRIFVNEKTCLFEKIYYLIGGCNYNGYLHNDCEKSFITEMLKECISPEIFQKNSSLFNNIKQYALPTKNDKRDYLNHICNLPDQDPPDVLYLTESELLEYNKIKTKNFLNLGLKMIENKEECMLSKNEFRVLCIIDDLLSVFPEKVNSNITNIDNECILREIIFYNNLLKMIRDSLRTLKSAYGGECNVTEDLKEITLSLLKNKIPKIWLKNCYPTLQDLSKFSKTIFNNVKYFENFFINPKQFLLSAFYFPNSILPHFKLNCARKSNTSVCNIEFEFITFKEDQDCIVFDGLFMFGARYDNNEHQIVELLPKTFYSVLCPLLIKCRTITNEVIDLENKLKCCIFKTRPFSGEDLYLPGTQNFITNVLLKCSKTKSFWIKRGLNQQTAEELFAMGSPEVPFVEDQAASVLLEQSMYRPDERVYSKSNYIQQVHKPHQIQTPAGMEPVIQQTYTQKRVERDDVAERVVKTISVTDINETSGRGTRITLSEQQLDPDYGLSNEAKDTILVKETVSVTPSYKTTARDVIHEVTTPKVQIDPGELAMLVEQESQDIENTLKIVPPDLVLHEDRYSVKKRLQKLRLNTESMILLEESVVNPTPTADEAMVETPPEALASIMHTVESGVTPECAPDQVFHTLFEEKTTEQSVILSSIGPGPLQDVMVPQTLGKEIHKESMTPDLTELTNIFKNVTDAKDWPPVNIFNSVMDKEAKSPSKDVQMKTYKPLEDEEMPWTEQDIAPMASIVGAEPTAILDPINIADLENLEKELARGIEYFVEADPVQYMSRVQLRGTHPPPWFPGYIYALPEFPDVVKLARNPDEVFIAGWRSCQPRIIPDQSISILF